jgi:hypothetical protein
MSIIKHRGPATVTFVPLATGLGIGRHGSQRQDLAHDGTKTSGLMCNLIGGTNFGGQAL